MTRVARPHQFAPHRGAVPVLALVLAFLVFVPEASLAGSWASPAPVADAGNSSEPSAVAPAQLVQPANQPLPILPQILLLLAVAIWLACRSLPVAEAVLRLREPPPAPGRCGRAVLQAFLN